MSDSNLFCDEPSCGQPAYSFGFLKCTEKTKACLAHTHIMLSKSSTAFDIAGYRFIESLQDAPIYQQRRYAMHMGLGKLSTRETQCEIDWQEAEKRLEEAENAILMVVKRSFVEMRQRALMRYEAVKLNLSYHRSNLERLVLDKDFQLSPQETVFCESDPMGPLFKCACGDASLQVATALMQRFHILPEGEIDQIDLEERRESVEKLSIAAQELAKQGEPDLAKEVAEYAQELGAGEADFSASALYYKQQIADSLNTFLPSASLQQTAQAVSRKYIAESQAFMQVGDYTKARNKLQRGKALLQRWNMSNPELSLHLGKTLLHFALWTDAETELKTAFETQEVDSRMSLQLHNALIDSAYQSGNWNSAVELSMQALQTWGNSSFRSDLLVTLFYLVNALNWLDDSSEADTLIDQWIEFLHCENVIHQCLRLLIYVKRPEDLDEQIRLFEEAIKQAQQHLPNSFFLASSLYSLGYIYPEESEKTEAMYLQACQIHVVHFPFSFEYASCLKHLGDLHSQQKRQEEALEAFLAAYSIYSACYSQSLSFASLLLSLGNLYGEMERKQEEEQSYLMACRIYIACNSNSILLGHCHYNLGLIYAEAERNEEAMQQFIAALTVYNVTDSPENVKKCNSEIQDLIS